jgi:hypothetical protein
MLFELRYCAEWPRLVSNSNWTVTTLHTETHPASRHADLSTTTMCVLSYRSFSVCKGIPGTFWLPYVLVHAGFSLADSSTLKMEAIRSSVMSVHTGTWRCQNPENGFILSHCCENLKSYIVFSFLFTSNVCPFPVKYHYLPLACLEFSSFHPSPRISMVHLHW